MVVVVVGVHVVFEVFARFPACQQRLLAGLGLFLEAQASLFRLLVAERVVHVPRRVELHRRKNKNNWIQSDQVLKNKVCVLSVTNPVGNL